MATFGRNGRCVLTLTVFGGRGHLDGERGFGDRLNGRPKIIVDVLLANLIETIVHELVLLRDGRAQLLVAVMSRCCSWGEGEGGGEMKRVNYEKYFKLSFKQKQKRVHGLLSSRITVACVGSKTGGFVVFIVGVRYSFLRTTTRGTRPGPKDERCGVVVVVEGLAVAVLVPDRIAGRVRFLKKGTAVEGLPAGVVLDDEGGATLLLLYLYTGRVLNLT